MTESPESFEEWKARTSPGRSPRASGRNRRLVAGVFGVLGLLCFWVDEPGAKILAVGLLVLAAENVVHVYVIRRAPEAEASPTSVIVRGVALGVTLVLAVVAAVTSSVLAVLVVVVLVGLDLADDPSFLRWAWRTLRRRG